MRKCVSILSGIVCAAVVLFAGSGIGSAAEQIQTPERIFEASVPARVAFTSNAQLWLLDGSDPKAKPKQITTTGAVEIAGWSPDGKWLFYLHNQNPADASSGNVLWAVKADGSGAFQVDPRRVLEKPKWASDAKTFAYMVQSTQTGGPDNAYSPEFVVARLDGERVQKLLEQRREIEDFAWLPDGKRLLVSVPAAKGRPITLELTDLAGKKLAAYALGGPPNVEEGIYPYSAEGLTLSPDGKRVAYYVRVSSGSLSADGVSIQLFDLTKPDRKPVEIGVGLAYPEWFSWSPDSSRLAFIDGSGRIATENKHLTLADKDGKIVHAGQPGKVDALPRWPEKAADSLYFARGFENAKWLGNYDPKQLLISGQRIWMRDTQGRALPVTKGPEGTADTYPHPSPDGKQLIFVRLDGAEHGSVYARTTDGQEKELVRHVTGDPGYYANYLPEWVGVYWIQSE
ncbi:MULTISPECIES: TolB family protein [Brevibacillus]|uniref:TolB family protein n=1 Tax=Brevibacillus sp. FSL K6-2834 TaxID=2954680 RepID=UPI003157F2EC